MGGNCACFDVEKETELKISQHNKLIKEKSAPKKRPNWEEHFNEFIRSPPVLSQKIKV